MEKVHTVGSWCHGATGGKPALCAAGTRTVCAFDCCFWQHTCDMSLHLCLRHSALLHRTAFKCISISLPSWDKRDLTMAASWLGLLSMGVFYLAVLATGIWASRKAKLEERRSSGRASEVTMVGGRNLNIWVSILTMTGRSRKERAELCYFNAGLECWKTFVWIFYSHLGGRRLYFKLCWNYVQSHQGPSVAHCSSCLHNEHGRR